MLRVRVVRVDLELAFPLACRSLDSVVDQYLSLEIANGVEVKVQRSSVVQVLPKGTIK